MNHLLFSLKLLSKSFCIELFLLLLLQLLIFKELCESFILMHSFLFVLHHFNLLSLPLACHILFVLSFVVIKHSSFVWLMLDAFLFEPIFIFVLLLFNKLVFPGLEIFMIFVMFVHELLELVHLNSGLEIKLLNTLHMTSLVFKCFFIILLKLFDRFLFFNLAYQILKWLSSLKA